MANFKNS